MRLLRAAALTAILALAVTAYAAPTRAQPPVDRIARPTWTRCGDRQLDAAGAQCADVPVPLDYADPSGPRITVAVSRLRATDPARRRGVLFTNPGGPGDPGLDFILTVRQALSPAARAGYDLIGMDPRGVGRSAPVRCHWPVPGMLRAAGVEPTQFAGDVSVAAELAHRCLAANGPRIRHYTTRNTARDIDTVRAALGESRINYYGWSYGTYLGAVYAQLFGDRIDRLVLDSAVDPDRYFTGTLADMGPANEAGLDGWARWTAQHRARYHLGDTAADVRATVERLNQRAAHEPIALGRLRVDAHTLPMLLLLGLTSQYHDAELADVVGDLVASAAGRPVVLSAASRQVAAELASDDESAMAAIVCGDVAVPRNPLWYWENIRRDRTREPVFGAFADTITPCAFWPDPVEPPTHVRNSVPALILQATGDTRTAYSEGVALHRDLSTSRLVTLAGVRIHGVFRPDLSPCVDAAVNRYLLDGELPPHDLLCSLGER